MGSVVSYIFQSPPTEKQKCRRCSSGGPATYRGQYHKDDAESVDDAVQMFRKLDAVPANVWTYDLARYWVGTSFAGNGRVTVQFRACDSCANDTAVRMLHHHPEGWDDENIAYFYEYEPLKMVDERITILVLP